MSAEVFIATHKAGPDFRGEIGARQEQKIREGHSMSRIGVLAGILIEEGRRGLLELDRSRVLTGNAGEEREEDGARTLTEKEKQMITAEEACIVLGHIILHVEQTLVTGEFSLSDFVNDVNGSFTGTTADRFPQTRQSDSQLTLKDWKQMIGLAREDRTLSVFIEHPQYLPPGLQEYLFFNPIPQMVFYQNLHLDPRLCDYKDLAESLIDLHIGDAKGNFEDKKFTPEIRKKLDRFLTGENVEEAVKDESNPSEDLEFTAEMRQRLNSFLESYVPVSSEATGLENARENTQDKTFTSEMKKAFLEKYTA